MIKIKMLLVYSWKFPISAAISPYRASILPNCIVDRFVESMACGESSMCCTLA